MLNKALNITLILLSFNLFGQTERYSLDTSYQVVIIGTDTIEGFHSDIGITNAKFNQFTKYIFKRKNYKIPRKVNQKVNYHIEYLVHYDPFIFGEYKNGKPAGIWRYLNKGYDPNDCNSKSIIKTVEYYKDSIKAQINGYGVSKVLTFNSDSSQIKGLITLGREYEIKLNCIDGACTFLNDNQTIAKCPISDWETKLMKLDYEYTISKLTN